MNVNTNIHGKNHGKSKRSLRHLRLDAKFRDRSLSRRRLDRPRLISDGFYAGAEILNMGYKDSASTFAIVVFSILKVLIFGALGHRTLASVTFDNLHSRQRLRSSSPAP